MGFIERLRQEKLREESERKAKEARQARAFQSSRPAESLIDQEERSRKYYEESGCHDLVNELASVIDGSVREYKSSVVEPDSSTKEIIEDFQLNLKRTKSTSFRAPDWHRWKSYKESGVGSHVVFLQWITNKRRVGNTEYLTSNLIAVETCPDGTIYFYTGLFGSSSIPLNQWRSDQTISERALERAYHNSKTKNRKFDSSGYSSPEYGGMGR